MLSRHWLCLPVGFLAVQAFPGCAQQETTPATSGTGQVQQAVWSFPNPAQDSGDANSLEANIVVQLAPRPGATLGCVGTLVTSTMVLASRFAVSAQGCGSQPIIRVGAYSQSFLQEVESARVIEMPDPSWNGPSSSATDLALVVLKTPVLVHARVPRQEFKAPTSSSKIDKGFYQYPGVGVAGWSPVDVFGNRNEIYASRRQSLIAPDGWSLYRYAEISGSLDKAFWVKLAFTSMGYPQGGLRDGDSGAPLFIQDAAGARQVIGVASLIAKPPASGASPTTLPGLEGACRINDGTREFWGCDAFIDVTAERPRSWLIANLRDDSRGKNWLASHPRLDGKSGEPRIGEVDYYGECKAGDGDCDHIFDRNADNSARDNCPAAYNPGQEDADDDNAGDACDVCKSIPGQGCNPVTKVEATGQNFDNGNTRVITQGVVSRREDRPEPGTGRQVPVKANNLLRIKGVVEGTSNLVGNTRARTCNCDNLQDDPQLTETQKRDLCMRDGGRCERGTELYPRGGNWRAMTVVARKHGTDKRVEDIPCEYWDVSKSGPAYEEEWGWHYWEDFAASELGGDPKATSPGGDSTSEGSPRSVCKAVIWTGVKDFRKADGNSTDIADTDTNRRLRESKTFIDLQERAAAATLAESPIGHGVVVPPIATRWRFDPNDCPMCGLDSILDFGATHINPAPVSVQPALNTLRPEATLASPRFLNANSRNAVVARTMTLVDKCALGLPTQDNLTPMLRSALNKWGRRALLAAEDSQRGLRGAPILTVINPETHALLEAFYYDGGGTYQAAVQNSLAPSYAHGRSLVAAMSARRQEVAFFGENLAGEDRVMRVRVVDLRTSSMKQYEVKGLNGSLGVLASAYSAADDAYYVLETGYDGTSRRTRLVRIDAGSNAQVVGAWQPGDTFANYEMTVGVGNTLAVTASHGSKHAVVVFELRENMVSGRALLVGDEALAMPAFMTDKGLSLVYAAQDGLEPTLTPFLIIPPLRAGLTVGRDWSVSVEDINWVF